MYSDKITHDFHESHHDLHCFAVIIIVIFLSLKSKCGHFCSYLFLSLVVKGTPTIVVPQSNVKHCLEISLSHQCIWESLFIYYHSIMLHTYVFFYFFFSISISSFLKHAFQYIYQLYYSIKINSYQRSAGRHSNQHFHYH